MVKLSLEEGNRKLRFGFVDVVTQFLPGEMVNSRSRQKPSWEFGRIGGERENREYQKAAEAGEMDRLDEAGRLNVHPALWQWEKLENTLAHWIIPVGVQHLDITRDDAVSRDLIKLVLKACDFEIKSGLAAKSTAALRRARHPTSGKTVEQSNHLQSHHNRSITSPLHTHSSTCPY